MPKVHIVKQPQLELFPADISDQLAQVSQLIQDIKGAVTIMTEAWRDVEDKIQVVED